MNNEQIHQQRQIEQNLNQNKMLIKCLKTLMHRLLHQYRSQSYNSNGIVTQYYKQLLDYQHEREGNRQIQSQTHSYTIVSQDDNKNRLSQQISSIAFYSKPQCKQLVKIWPEIGVFIWQISRSPKWYYQMLKNEQIYAEENQCIDMHVFTTKIYKKVISQAKKMTIYTKVFQSICADQIYFFLQEVSLQICGCFKSGQKIVINELNYVTEIVQKSEIITFYFLYKIFKDTANSCRKRISQQLQQSLFRNIQTQVVAGFANYIIQKYEVLDMEMNREKQMQSKVSITQRIMNANHVKWRQAIRQDGEIGILVQLQDQKDDTKSLNYMLVFDQNGDLSMVNSNSLHMQWKVCKKAQQNYEIVNLVKSKKALAERMRNSSTAPIQMTLLQNVGVLGGSMGKCLAQIDMYDNVGDFMVSLSKRTIIGGSFNYLLMSVPLLGYFFVTGGFTYTFYYIFSNQYANNDKKIRQLRNITIGSVTSIGSGLIGATIGQSLIPIPVLGAFIGGLVGGFIGEFGARAIGSAIQTAKFKQTIQQMRNTIQPKGFWNVTDQTLRILQINKQKFYQTIPCKLEHKLNCDRIWLTIIFFTLLCFHQSKQRIKFMQQKMKNAKKVEKNLSQYQMIEANQHMSESKQYEPSIDFMCILRYFDQHHIIIIQFHDEITHLLNKMFAKIK